MSRYLILLLVSAACAAPDVVPPLPSDETTVSIGSTEASVPGLPEVGDSQRRQRKLARELSTAAREGNYARARELVGQLEELEIQPLVDEAHALLAAGDPEGALAVVERALEVAPDGPSTRLLHGEAALRVGRRLRDTALMESALASFATAAAAGSPRGGVDRWYRRAFMVHALRGACHAARALGHNEQALTFATRELDWARGHKNRATLYQDLGEWPEQTFVQACFDVFTEVREDQPERAAELVAQMEQQLSWLMTRRPRDPWAWSMLAAVLLREERFQDAVDAALGGLHAAPQDRVLPGQLADAARGAGGGERVLAVFARLQKQQPRVALAWWYAAFERFDAAVTALDEGRIDELRHAEADFRRCRELEAEYTEPCLDYEAMCRNAAGWILFEREEFEAAADMFRSMEDLFPRGMTWHIPGRLPSGAQGLHFVGRGYADRDDLVAAARVFLELHRYGPENVDWANNAGFFHREAGARMESYAAEATSMAGGDLKTKERRVRVLEAAGLPLPADEDEAAWRDALGRAGEPLLARSREMFETSYASYLAAAELAPHNVRIVNDTALIPVHHLGRDLERAEAYLMRCVELGAEQMKDAGDMDQEQRIALTQAWGDAHENLGVLYLQHLHDPTTARTWLEKSLEIGPDPRPVVTELHLPRCEEMSKRDD